MSDADFGPVKALWLAFMLLHEGNAQHKRGFRLQSVPPSHSVLHAIEELSEVARELTMGADREKVVQETGDALACLIHFLVAQGLGPAEVGLSALAKLDRDFPEGGEAARGDAERDMSPPYRPENSHAEHELEVGAGHGCAICLRIQLRAAEMGESAELRDAREAMIDVARRARRALGGLIRAESSPAEWDTDDGSLLDPLPDEGPVWEGRPGEHPLARMLRDRLAAYDRALRGDSDNPVNRP